MWETIKRWLQRLWGQLAPPLHALSLYLIDIAVSVIAYAVFCGGAVLIRYFGDFWKDPTASKVLKFAEWLITVIGVFAVTAIVLCSTVKFLNSLFVIFFGIDFINMIKERLGLDDSDGQSQVQPPGPQAPRPSRGQTQGSSSPKPAAEAPTQPGTQTPDASPAGQSGRQASKPRRQSDDQPKGQSEDQLKNTPDKFPRRPD